MGFVIRLIIWALEIYALLVILYVLMLWLFQFKIISGNNPHLIKFWSVLMKLVAPPLDKIRLAFPPSWSVDLSPVALLIGLYIIQRLLIRFLL